MTKLFFRLCEAESFVDFVPLTFVTDERAYITPSLRMRAIIVASQRYFLRMTSCVLGRLLFSSSSCMNAGVFLLLLIQCAGDGLHAAAADVGGEDQSDCFGRFLHDDNFLCVLVLEVAEGRDGHDPFLLLLPVAGSHTAAAVAGIEVINQAL